jgi:hypothetical protein
MPIVVHESPVELEAQKKHLKQNGYVYRTAAIVLDVSPQYLSDVLNGWQTSPTLPDRILTLGPCPESLISKRTRNRMERGSES